MFIHNSQADDDSDDDGPNILPPPSMKAALNGLRTVLRHEESSPDSCFENIKLLERLEKQYLFKEADGWFG